MPIEWVKSIYESFRNLPKVQVGQGHPALAGRIGTVVRYGFDGNNQFNMLVIPGIKGKKVVAVKHCSLHSIGEWVLSEEDKRECCGQDEAGSLVIGEGKRAPTPSKGSGLKSSASAVSAGVILSKEV